MADAKTETQQDDPKERETPAPQDVNADEIEMRPHIPEGTSSISDVDIDQTAKHNEKGEGVHLTSATFGKVVSDYATDAAGLTPEDNAKRADERSSVTVDSSASKDDDKDDKSTRKS